MKERKLSWNKEYYYEDGAWWWVDGEWKDEQVNHLYSIHCFECAYSGEEHTGGDGIMHIRTDREDGIETNIWMCQKCGQLYEEYMKYWIEDGEYLYGDGGYDCLEIPKEDRHWMMDITYITITEKGEREVH